MNGIVVFANAVGADSLFVNALNYAGLGVVALIALYLLREQGRETRSQMDKVTQCFMDSLASERKSATDNTTRITDRVSLDHQQCRLEHLGICDQMKSLLEKQQTIINGIEELLERDAHAK